MFFLWKIFTTWQKNDGGQGVIGKKTQILDISMNFFHV
jgi:hypothetical protein